MASLNQIDPKKFYDVSELCESKFFHWVNSRAAYVNAILTDKMGNDVLKAVIVGTGNNRRYQIKGSNVIKYLVRMEEVMK